jgi:hypothetical protein
MSKYKKKAIPKALKEQVWRLTNGDSLTGSCFVCKNVLYFNNFEAGHIQAESQGGSTSVTNLKATCKPCNRSCSTKDMNIFKDVIETIVVISEDEKKQILLQQEKIQIDLKEKENAIKQIIAEQISVLQRACNKVRVSYGKTSSTLQKAVDKNKKIVQKENNKLNKLSKKYSIPIQDDPSTNHIKTCVLNAMMWS